MGLLVLYIVGGSRGKDDKSVFKSVCINVTMGQIMLEWVDYLICRCSLYAGNMVPRSASMRLTY